MKKLVAACLLLLACSWAYADDADRQVVDASDPTKIYTFAGAGLKYSEYANGESMAELRATANFGLSDSDMFSVEAGYGKHQGSKVPGGSDGLTNARGRWFHLFNMDYTIDSGYRGMATQVDVQLAGSLKGTDGQNTVAFGVLPAFGINEEWNFYLAANLVNTWDKSFKHYNGAGVGLAPLLSFSPDNWWDGAFIFMWPNYTRFVSGDLKGEGAGNIDFTVGGNLSDTIVWSVVAQKNVDKDLRSFRNEVETDLKNDWNVYFTVNTYF